MKQLRHSISLLMVGFLLMTLPSTLSVGVSAEKASSLPAQDAVVVWDMEALPDDLGMAGWTRDNQGPGFGVSGGYIDMYGAAGKGVDGSRALQWVYNGPMDDKYWGNTVSIDLTKDTTATTDWSNSKIVWFWIDATELPANLFVLLYLNNTLPNADAIYYRRSESGQLETCRTMIDTTGTASWLNGRLVLGGFRGWVGLPLSSFPDTVDFTAVASLGLYTEMSTTVAKSVYFDNFLLSQDDNPQNPPRPEPQPGKELADREDAYAYLYATFQGDGAEQVKLRYLVSTDGYHFTALNNGNPVLASTVGNHSIRDPYIFIDEEGVFRLISSDVRVDGNWNNHTIVTYSSRDLIRWEEGTVLDIDTVGPHPLTHVWAPEALYDPEVEAYMLYWCAGATGGGVWSRQIWAAYTSDFRSFDSAPFLLYSDHGAVGSNMFDPHIEYHDGKYHLYFADATEDGGTKVRRASSLYASGPYGDLTGSLQTDDYLSEGPNFHKIIGEDTYILMSDDYDAGQIVFRQTSDFETFTTLTLGTDYSFDIFTRSGSIIQLTRAEYDALMTVYGNGAGGLGDVNGDGRVSVADTRMALRAVVGKTELTVEQAQRADINGDGSLTTADARRILRKAVGKE